MADRPPLEGLADAQRRVLVAVVEGYRAREGMKDRLRALNEWEIARRSGWTTLRHTEYMRDPTRDNLMTVLAELEQLGLVSTWERGASYDSFVPTERGGSIVDVMNGQATAAETTELSDHPSPASDPVVERLDEIVRLLRSIDSRLAR